MKHLHINDCAAVAALLPEQGPILIRTPNIFMPTYPQYKLFNHKVRYWLVYVFLYCLIHQPKHIWFHSALLEFRLLSKVKFLFRAKFIYWSHGSDLRNKVVPGYLKKASIQYTSTDNAIAGSLSWVIRKVPIDQQLFYPEKKITGSTLVLQYERTLLANILQYCHTHQLQEPIIIKPREQPVPYEEFASLLRKTDYFFESKGLYPERSKSCIEAQACGCKVIEEHELW